MDTDKVIKKIEEIAAKIYQKEYNVYAELATVIPLIDIIYQTFLQLIPQLNEIGMELDADGILFQLQNVVDAIDKRDTIRIYDSLVYEIRETLMLYREIETIMEQ